MESQAESPVVSKPGEEALAVESVPTEVAEGMPEAGMAEAPLVKGASV
jgi:hypothetical protein